MNKKVVAMFVVCIFIDNVKHATYTRFRNTHTKQNAEAFFPNIFYMTSQKKGNVLREGGDIKSVL